MSDDNLVYDQELGWHDPVDPLGSLGITCTDGRTHFTYHGVGDWAFHVPRNANFALLRLCIDDAERRSRESG